MSQEEKSEKKIRVLLLAESPYFGGITSHLLSILDAFRDSPEFEFLVATFPPRRRDVTLIDECRRRGIAVRIFAMAFAWDWRVLRALRRFVKAQRIDLIHTHNYRATLLCALAAPGPPVINTFHGMIVEPGRRLRFWQWLELIVMRRHSLTIACSEYLRAQLVSQGQRPDRIRVIYNSCALSAPEDGALTRGSLELSPNDLVVAYVGRLAGGKGVDTLIDAVSRAPGWTLLVAGDGPQRRALEQRANSANAPVRFLGFVDDPSLVYAVADVVALVSQMEALPTVLLEAAAHAKPVIATRVGGIPEIVDNDVNGLLVAPGDVGAVAASLEYLREPAARKRMGGANQTVWRERFTKYHMVKALSAVYHEATRQ